MGDELLIDGVFDRIAVDVQRFDDLLALDFAVSECV